MIITTHKKVTITIAAMTYNQPLLTEILHADLHPFLEVIDNGSTVPIPFTTIRIPENRYFAGGWNHAMPHFDTEWVAMLNDDITGISWRMIMKLVEKADDYGFSVISPTFNSPHLHMQQQSHGLRQVHSIDWVAAIIRKDAWDAVGGFNADAFPGYGSDLDISYRLKQKGYRLAVSDDHVIHHIGGKAAIEGGTQHIQGNVLSMNESFQRLYGASDWVDFTNRFLAI